MASDRSREARRLASECLALARQTSDPLARTSRLDMAQKWIDVAELSEHDPWNDALRRRVIQAKAYPVDSGSATCCGLNERIRSVAGTTIDGQRAFAFAISGSVF